MPKKYIPEESGTFSSRKFILSIISLILITGLSLVAAWLPGIQPILSTFISGIIGVLSLYYAGNVINKHVVGKKLVELKKAGEQ